MNTAAREVEIEGAHLSEDSLVVGEVPRRSVFGRAEAYSAPLASIGRLEERYFSAKKTLLSFVAWPAVTIGVFYLVGSSWYGR